MATTRERGSVVVLYNSVSDEGYDQLRDVDPETLGFKPEYDIAVSTVAEEYAAIVDGLKEAGFKAREVNLAEDIKKLERLVRRNPPDAVFNLVEGFHDDADLEPAVAGFLDLYRIPYTGAAPLALGNCRRKGLMKQLLLANGVPTPKYLQLNKPKIAVRHGLHYPLIIKPAREDASAGVDEKSVVYDRAELLAQLERVFDEFDPPILVEEFIEGREFHVGVLGNDPGEVLPPLEYDFSEMPDDQPSLISYAAKWDPLAEVFHRVGSHCPADMTKRLKKKIEDVALRAYHVSGCRDYARLDLRVSADNHVYVLEVNPNPDLTEGVSFMHSAEVAGYTFSKTLRKIVEMALDRTHIPEPDPPVALQ
ncbi:MAG: ATP-grasp domain-containing protein [Gemmatimonadales bacterium]|jgi:D-alanine-D-alanine ligase|nr:MAG: ATP-grasp domain-containing protein [Gemmatimonadales bacterium]